MRAQKADRRCRVLVTSNLESTFLGCVVMCPEFLMAVDCGQSNLVI
jgi:hypothetical protein